jgi:hypothetical protein
VYSRRMAAAMSAAALVASVLFWAWPGDVPEPEGPEVWILQLAEPPLARYDGGLPGLPATSPRVTGAPRLDVRSEAAVAYLNHLRQRQDEVLARLDRALGRRVEVAARYAHALNGLAVRLTSAEASRLEGLPGLTAVTPNTAARPSGDISHDIALSASIWDGATGSGLATRGEGIVIGILDTGINPLHPSFAATDGDGHTHTNPFGSGTFLGVCDPTHPEHDPICNDKLIGAWDFTGQGARDGNGHGSFVASLAAGNRHEAEFMVAADTWRRVIQGAAPRANLISYRVCAISCPVTGIVAALEQAIADGVHVLIYALTGPDNPWGSPNAEALLSAFEAGIFVSASGGNDGPAPGSVDNTAPWTTQVIATSHHRVIGHSLDVIEPTGSPLTGIAALPGDGPGVLANITAPLVDAATVAPDEPLGCGPTDPGPIFSGGIALIQRGLCTFLIKVQWASRGGAVAVIIYNNGGGPPVSMVGLETFTDIPAAMVSLNDGAALAAQAAGGSTTVRLSRDTALVLEDAWRDVVSGISSRGPSAFDLLAPSLAAPSFNSLGAYAAGAEGASTYVMLFGSSAGTGLVAGAGALLRALHPTWSPAEIRSALIGTARTEGVLKEDGVTPAGAFDRGGGVLDLDRAGRVGLVLDETRPNFEGANPAAGGDPRTLNLPAFVDRDCLRSCTWTRTLRSAADGPASYAATVTASPGLTLLVEPATFTLGPGETQAVLVRAEVSGAAPGTWLFGEVGFETGASHPGGRPIAPVRYQVAVLPSPPPHGEEIAAVDALDEAVTEMGLDEGTDRSLHATLDAARASLEAGNVEAACGQLRALINQTRALSGRRLTVAQAATIIASAEAIRAALGCE